MPRISRAEYDQVLDQLAALLRRKPHTARAICDALACSKPIAYARIKALRKRLARGERLRTERVRESARGPLSVAYSIRAR